MSRMDEYLMAIITGENEDLPEPRSSTEREFYEAAKKGFGGGGASSWNDLADKPFYETTVMGDTLTWDGDTSKVETIDPTGSGQLLLCLISDTVPTSSDFANGAKIVFGSGTKLELTADEILPIGNGVLAESEFNFVIVSNDNTTVTVPYAGITLTVTFPKKGVYFGMAVGSGYTRSLTITGYTGFKTTKIKALDVKYLPKAHQFGDVPIGDTLTWDGSTEGRPIIDLGDGLSFIRVSDNTPTIDDFANGYSWVHSDGSTGAVTPDNIQFDEATGVIIGGSTAQDSLLLVVIPYPNFEYTGTIIPDEGIYALYFGSGADYFRTLTIPAYQFTEIKTIEPKYLPTKKNSTIFYCSAINDDNSTDRVMYIDEALTTPATPTEVYDAYVNGDIVIVDSYNAIPQFLPIEVIFPIVDGTVVMALVYILYRSQGNLITHTCKASIDD